MSAAENENVLTEGLRELAGFSLQPEQVKSLLMYLDQLSRWNRTYNLTAVRDPVEMVSKHLLDSLSVLPWVGGGRLLDAGTGAGLPGLPIAIALPDLHVTLLDSAGKKIRFLNHVKRQLSISNIEPVQARLEAWQAAAEFDSIISRAFTSLASFASAVRQSGAVNSRLLAMKGRLPADEIDELPEWVRVDLVERLSVPGLQQDRHLVIMSLII